MKILHLIHKIQNRGAETFASQLSNHLENLGHQVKIVALYDGSAKLPYNSSILNLKSNFSFRFFNLKAWKELSDIIKEFQPDIVQANAGDTLKFAVFSKLIFGWKTSIVFRNASEIGRYLDSWPKKIYNAFLFSNTDLIISVSQASKMDILKLFPSLANKTEVIPVGLENIKSIEPFSYKPEGDCHIAHVGGFSFEKNHEGLIQIFKNLLAQRRDVHLHLLGDGLLRPKIETLVEKMGLSRNIYFHGYVNNSLPYIKAADILVLPSIIEGLPGVLLEAMYCKTPVIAYNVGGISEIVNPNTGKIIKEGDEYSFAKAMKTVLATDNDEQIDNAYKMVKNEFMNEKISRDFVAAYKKLLHRNLN